MQLLGVSSPCATLVWVFFGCESPVARSVCINKEYGDQLYCKSKASPGRSSSLCLSHRHPAHPQGTELLARCSLPCLREEGVLKVARKKAKIGLSNVVRVSWQPRLPRRSPLCGSPGCAQLGVGDLREMGRHVDLILQLLLLPTSVRAAEGLKGLSSRRTEGDVVRSPPWGETREVPLRGLCAALVRLKTALKPQITPLLMSPP